MLEFGGKSSSGKSASHLDGTFINVPTILSATDISHQDIFHNGKPVDCGLELKLDVGQSFYPTWKVYGNFKVGEGGKMDWGSAFIVREFLETLGIKGNLNEDGSIPNEVLQELIGKQFIRLSYVRGFDANKGKKRYDDFRFVAVVGDYGNAVEVEKAAKKLTERFIRDVKSGRVRNFVPDAENQNQPF